MIARMKDTSKYFAIKAVNKSFIQRVPQDGFAHVIGGIRQGSHGGEKCAGRYEPSVYHPSRVFLSSSARMGMVDRRIRTTYIT